MQFIIRLCWYYICILLVLIPTCVHGSSIIDLPALSLDKRQITLFGLSSGGAMAIQYGMVFSDEVAGIGVIAAAPYYCSNGTLIFALSRCMRGFPTINNDALIEKARQLSQKNKIAAIASIKKQRVWLFSGTKDSIVHQSVMNSTHKFYQHFLPANQLRYVKTIPAGHAFISNQATVTTPCASTQSPFINHCGNIDTAHAALSWLYGTLNNKSMKLTGELYRFNQKPFISRHSSLADTGYLYIPASCKNNRDCKLHLVLSGCQQSIDQIGDTVPMNTNSIYWADSNNIVVLFPQVTMCPDLGNPYACWDWWGYSSERFATKDAPQLQALHAMVARLTQKPSTKREPMRTTLDIELTNPVSDELDRQR